MSGPKSTIPGIRAFTVSSVRHIPAYHKGFPRSRGSLKGTIITGWKEALTAWSNTQWIPTLAIPPAIPSRLRAPKTNRCHSTLTKAPNTPSPRHRRINSLVLCQCSLVLVAWYPQVILNPPVSGLSPFLPLATLHMASVFSSTPKWGRIAQTSWGDGNMRLNLAFGGGVNFPSVALVSPTPEPRQLG